MFSLDKSIYFDNGTAARHYEFSDVQSIEIAVRRELRKSNIPEMQ